MEDRPTLVDPLNEDDDEPEEAEADTVEVIGSGGGKIVHGVEFEEDSEEVIKTSNLVAMLATGEDGGSELYDKIFTTAAIQLQRAKEMGRDISGASLTSEELNSHTIGVSWSDNDDSSTETEVELEQDVVDAVEEDDEEVEDSSEKESTEQEE